MAIDIAKAAKLGTHRLLGKSVLSHLRCIGTCLRFSSAEALEAEATTDARTFHK